MTVDAGRSRAERIEAAIRKLRGVRFVRVLFDENEKVRDVHVTTSSERPAKHVVRDIQTLMLARFSETLDRRYVSVARETPADPGAASAAPFGAEAPANGPAPGSRDETGPRLERVADRIRFVSVNLYVSGPRAQAQVELRWKGITRMGSASGTATRDSAHQLVAAATVAALEEYLEEDWSLGVQGVQFVRLGKAEAVVVGLTLLAHRREKSLAGCCTVEQDVPQAVALATLAALNRVVGGLETREPIEYVLRPTSFLEASEAKKT